VETRLIQCATCGAEIDLVSGRCPYCPVPGVPSAAPPAPSPGPPPAEEVPPPATDPERERALGHLLFEAEEALARGNAEKALVVASRAVKERPESLTARALVERSRRLLLRGRRRERLERRVREAEELLARGDLAAAERIVNSALKLVPDHTGALHLFGRLRQHSLSAGTAEAEAEIELLRLARDRAARALDAARKAATAGWEHRALLSVRRGLSLVPDDRGLLDFYRELQATVAQRDAVRARARAQLSQVRAGLELLEQGRFDESLRILRALLREDPGSTRAQAAIQQVRQAWLRARGVAVGPGPVAAVAPKPEPSRPAPAAAPPPAASPPPRPYTPLPPPTRTAPPPAAPAVRRPARRRGRTPLGLVLGGAAAFAGVLGFLFLRRDAPRHEGTPSVVVTQPGLEARRSSPEREAILGPLVELDPGLQTAVEEALASYAHALESGDEARLARARPDLSSADRQARIAPFVGARDIRVSLRVIEVSVAGESAVVRIERTDTVGGSGALAAETLRFLNRGGEWLLK
jgi:tetratricopeptide (TPR) repeat protein